MHRGSLSRRQVLAGAVGLGVAPASPAAPAAFQHRAYLGWITDLASRPDTAAAWPSMRLDPPLLDDYRRTFRLLERLGFNAIVIWGFYVSRAWPLDISSAVPPARGALVERLIGAAHERGIRVYTGLGVYSWGFEEIIRAHPALSRTNPRAMCASQPESWEWMRRVIDFAFTRFPVDGASLQSADQGRCTCPQCRTWSDTAYHAQLDIRAADYIRARWPGKTVAVSGWGMRFDDPAALPDLRELGRHIDYLIDVRDSAAARDPALRRRLTQELPCAFGTLGGPQVEPPQHWARDRWFLPTVRRQGEHLAQLAADGGRACEYFFHILTNPGDEVSVHVEGKTLADPATSWQRHLASTLEELYGVTKPATRDALAALFLDAEDAYLQYLPSLRSGTISLEPLIGDRPGPAVYIRRLTAAQRAAYADRVDAVTAGFRKLAPDVPGRRRIGLILRCLANVQRDLAAA